MKLYSSTQGQGQDVVLLHGWGLNGAVFEELAAALALAYRVTVFDLPGHGRSPLGGARTLDDFAAAVARDAPPEAAWIGWSLGGLIALRVAAGQPERVTRLVLLNASPRFSRGPDWTHAQEHRVQAQFHDALQNNWRGTLLRFLALEAQGSDHAREELRLLRERVFAHGEPEPAALNAGLEILRDADLREAFATSRVPALAVLGERDALMPAAVAADLRALRPDVAVTVVRGAAHAPFLSHAHDCLNPVLAFLRGAA